MKAIITGFGNALTGAAPRELELEVEHQGLIEDRALRETVRDKLEDHFRTIWQLPVTITFDDELLAFH